MLLEDFRDKMLTERVVLIQKTWRRHFHRTRFVRKKRAALKIQTFVRMKIARRKFLRVIFVPISDSMKWCLGEEGILLAAGGFPGKDCQPEIG